MKIDLFQSCGHCWVFQICWHIECRTFTASSFRIWNSSAGLPSLPIALFIVMLLKAHLTSHSRMSGCRWVITPLWLSGSWRSFLYNSSVYSCHLFLISSASLKPILFLSFIVTIFAWNVPLISLIFLKTSGYASHYEKTTSKTQSQPSKGLFLVHTKSNPEVPAWVAFSKAFMGSGCLYPVTLESQEFLNSESDHWCAMQECEELH